MEHHKHHGHAHHTEDFKKRFVVSVILTIPVLILSEMIQMWFGFRLDLPFSKEILLALSTAIYFYGGWPFLNGIIHELRAKRPGMMTLVGTAISVAFFYSAGTAFFGGPDFFWELATLIDIMLLGHWLEAKSLRAASRALEEISRIMPKTAHLLRDGEVVDVAVSELRPGDVTVVRPGEKVPSDGLVIEGGSFVNEALLTGESKPIYKGVGDSVIGGSVNGDGMLKVRIERAGEDAYVYQVVRLVMQAQESRSKTQDIADRAAAMLFYVAMVTGIIAYIAWSILSPPSFALERAVTVLVIACPHALGLAIPLVVAISTSITARSGCLVRNRRAFEILKGVDVVVFDKTGTLTTGRFGVSDVVSFIPEDELLRLAAGVEVNSEHAIARSIVEYAVSKGLDVPGVQAFKAIPGRGAYAVIDGKEVYVGGSKLLMELGISVKDERVELIQNQGKTVVFVVVDGKPAGAIALSDIIRDESIEAVRMLKRMGIKVYMLTGDSEEVAGWVARELGIDSYFARVLPHEKAEKVKLLKDEGHVVAMVGDGINDAPALVTANVGIAIGAGTDVAIESADIILVRNDPRDTPRIIEISKRTFSKMVQNLWWAAGYNIFAIPAAAGLFYGLGMVISPAVGALLMSLSTVIVAMNSLTLRKYEPRLELAIKEHVYMDPVCGMEVQPDSAYSKLEYEGYVLYFCSEGCEKEFRKSPSKYMSKVREGHKEHVHHH